MAEYQNFKRNEILAYVRKNQKRSFDLRPSFEADLYGAKTMKLVITNKSGEVYINEIKVTKSAEELVSEIKIK